jgi:hypothetical protein
MTERGPAETNCRLPVDDRAERSLSMLLVVSSFLSASPTGLTTLIVVRFMVDLQ